MFSLLAATAMSPAYAGGILNEEDVHLGNYYGQSETVLHVRVTGTMNGATWGTGIYTDNSDIFTAAVHAGLVKVGEAKVVILTTLPGQSSYVGSVQNGVESTSYDAWEGKEA